MTKRFDVLARDVDQFYERYRRSLAMCYGADVEAGDKSREE